MPLPPHPTIPFAKTSRWRTLLLAASLAGCFTATTNHPSIGSQPAVARRMADGRVWTTLNLDRQLDGSFCYADAADNCAHYGRLYTWTTAKQACETLGDGWQVPTDQDWRGLASRYGGISSEGPDSGRGAFQELTYGGTSGFNALLGGGRSPGGAGYARLGAHGFYWTSTEDGLGTAVFYNFAEGRHALFRQAEGEKERGFSVRCIQVHR
jgi:uncharacterized protein (TIGR02145 family)